MRLRNTVWAALGSIVLMACVHLTPAPSFLQELSKQYHQLARSNGQPMGYHWFRADYFHSKGVQAANGRDVQPENPDTWDVPREYRPELKNAYDMLQIALVPDHKKVSDPINAADAQAYYDCWIDQAHKNWTPTNPESDCRAAFYKTMCRMYHGNCGKPDNIFRVFFDTNSAVIGQKGKEAVAHAVAAYKGGASEIIVAGHTDTVGKSASNLALSKKRAQAVKEALVKQGVPAAKINGKYFGEEQLLVPTPDNTPNAENRRVLIVVR